MSTTDTRAAFEAWYAKRHPNYPTSVHENPTWAHAHKMDDLEVWQAATEAAKATGTAGERKPEHAGWVDAFGNVWPLGAYSVDGKPNFHDAHKRNWKPLYTHPAPTLAHVDSNIFDLIHEWAARPEGNRHDAARAIIGSVNKSYSAGVADGRALAEAARQPAPVTLSDEQIDVLLAELAKTETLRITYAQARIFARAILAATNRSQP